MSDGKVLGGKKVKELLKFVDDVEKLDNVSRDINFFVEKHFDNPKFDSLNYWSTLYKDLMEKSSCGIVKRSGRVYNNRVLFKQDVASETSKHKAIKQNIDFKKLYYLKDHIVGQSDAVEKVKNRLLGSFLGLLMKTNR